MSRSPGLRGRTGQAISAVVMLRSPLLPHADDGRTLRWFDADIGNAGVRFDAMARFAKDVPFRCVGRASTAHPIRREGGRRGARGGSGMRVIHVYKDYYPPAVGGVEQTVVRMARWLLQRGDSVTVITSNPGRRRTVDETVDGVRVIRTAEFGRLLSVPFCPSMANQLARHPGDIYHLHYPNPTGELSWLWVRPRAPMVITYHGHVIRQAALMPLYSLLAHAVLGEANVIMASSSQLIKGSTILRRHRSRCAIVPLGVDLERLNVPAHSAAAAKLRARYHAPILLFVGRLVRYKGLNILLEAMRTIDATLVILGKGPQRAELEGQARQLGLGDRVVFAGLIPPDEVVQWIAAADVGVLPSILPNESFGLSMVELMACAVPVVCTELGTGTSFVNQDGESGFVVPPGDPAALAAAINRLLADNELRRRMGEAARARAVRMFSTDAMMRAVAECYEVARERWSAARAK